MWELDYKESWALKNWHFWTVVLEKTLESPLDCKEIQPVHPKGDQPWVFIGRTNAKAETPILWPPHAELTHWKRLWCLEGLGAGGWTRWTWIWVNSWSWWWTGRPGMLRFMGSQSWTQLSDWTELNWRSWNIWQLHSEWLVDSSIKTPVIFMQEVSLFRSDLRCILHSMISY